MALCAVGAGIISMFETFGRDFGTHAVVLSDWSITVSDDPRLVQFVRDRRLAGGGAVMHISSFAESWTYLAYQSQWSLPLFPIGLLAGIAMIFLWGAWIAQRITRAGCPHCGYSLDGLSDGALCPECGGDRKVV